MNTRTESADIYDGEHRLYAVGTGFTLEITGLGKPVYEIDDGSLSIDANEASATLLGPFDFEPTDADLVAEDVDIDIVVDDGEIEYVAGYYGSFPAYSPFHGVSDDGTVYEIESRFVVPEEPHVEGDDLLNIPERDEFCNTVRNLDNGWCTPVNHDRLYEWFEDDRLYGAIPVES